MFRQSIGTPILRFGKHFGLEEDRTGHFEKAPFSNQKPMVTKTALRV